MMKGKRQLFLVICLVLLYITARKCRQLTGEDDPYKTREEKFRSFNCFDMGLGTLSCIIKTCVKHYFLSRYHTFHNNPNNKDQNRHPSLIDTYNIGPVVSSGLDFFEMLYAGIADHKAEIAVATGSFIGAYAGGIFTSNRRLDFVYGTIMGGWLGGKVGLMVYDIGHGFDSLMHCYFHKGDVAANGPTHGDITTGSLALA